MLYVQLERFMNTKYGSPCLQIATEPDMFAQTMNPSTQEAKADRPL